MNIFYYIDIQFINHYIVKLFDYKIMYKIKTTCILFDLFYYKNAYTVILTK